MSGSNGFGVNLGLPRNSIEWSRGNRTFMGPIDTSYQGFTYQTAPGYFPNQVVGQPSLQLQPRYEFVPSGPELGPDGQILDYAMDSENTGSFDEATSAVYAKDLEKLSRMLGAEPKLVNHKDSKNQLTLLHHAARGGNTALIALLISKGADPCARDRSGLLPIHQATWFSRVDNAEELLKYPNSFGGFFLNQDYKLLIDNGIGELVRSQDPEQIMNWVAELCGLDADSLQNEFDTSKYMTHLWRLNGRFGGRASEGWYQEGMLIQRLWSQTEFLVARSSRLDKATQDFLKQEIVTTLDALHTTRRRWCFWSVLNSSEQHLSTMGRYLFAGEVSFLTTSLLLLKPGEEKVLPLGFPGHAIYCSIRRKEPSEGTGFLLRVDNLGAGCHEFHAITNGTYIQPRYMDLGEVLNEKGGVNQGFIEALGAVILPSISSNSGYQSLYGAINGYGGQLSKDRAIFSDCYQLSQQEVGNCALANHNASFFARCMRQRTADSTYDLYKDFSTFEKQRASTRVQYFSSQAALNKRRRKQIATAVANKIKQKHQQQGDVVAMITNIIKENLQVRDPLSELHWRDIKPVVEKGWVQALEVLLKYGADLKDPKRGLKPLCEQISRHGSYAVGSFILTELPQVLSARELKLIRDNLQQSSSDMSQLSSLLSQTLEPQIIKRSRVG